MRHNWFLLVGVVGIVGGLAVWQMAYILIPAGVAFVAVGFVKASRRGSA